MIVIALQGGGGEGIVMSFRDEGRNHRCGEHCEGSCCLLDGIREHNEEERRG